MTDLLTIILVILTGIVAEEALEHLARRLKGPLSQFLANPGGVIEAWKEEWKDNPLVPAKPVPSEPASRE